MDAGFELYGRSPAITMTVASDGDRMLLLADDGEQGRLRTARWT